MRFLVLIERTYFSSETRYCSRLVGSIEHIGLIEAIRDTIEKSLHLLKMKIRVKLNDLAEEEFRDIREITDQEISEQMKDIKHGVILTSIDIDICHMPKTTHLIKVVPQKVDVIDDRTSIVDTVLHYVAFGDVGQVTSKGETVEKAISGCKELIRDYMLSINHNKEKPIVIDSVDIDPIQVMDNPDTLYLTVEVSYY